MPNQATNPKTKLCKGFKNIHFSPYVNGTFDTPTRIFYAKKIENKFKYESSTEWADDMIIDDEFIYNGGDGNLETTGLSSQEQILLFGNKQAKGGVYVTDTDEAPTGAFLFERRKKAGHRRLYVVYACKCSPTDVSAETIEDGKGNYETKSIEYSIGSLEKDGVNYIYFFIDTDAEGVDSTQIENWYTQVQFPINPSKSGFNEVEAKSKSNNVSNKDS